MALPKSSLTILVINLILIRLALANSGHQAASQLENINSLDFSSSSILSSSPLSASSSSIDAISQNANQQQEINTSKHEYSVENKLNDYDQQQLHQSGKLMPKSEERSLAGLEQTIMGEKVTSTANITKPTKTKTSRSQKSSSSTSAINQLIGSLDRLDFKGLTNGLVKSLSTIMSPSNINTQQNSKSINKRSHANQSISLNQNDLSLNSVASQLMRLARGHEHNWEYDHGATAKSEWFWLVVPAVIIVGAGIIILPLIAACFVSMLTSGSYTLSTGRKKRDVTSGDDNRPHFGRSLLDMYKTMSSNQDFIQQLIGDLAKFDKALSSVERFVRNHTGNNYDDKDQQQQQRHEKQYQQMDAMQRANRNS